MPVLLKSNISHEETRGDILNYYNPSEIVSCLKNYPRNMIKVLISR